MASSFERLIENINSDRNNVYTEAEEEPNYAAILESVGIAMAGHRRDGVKVTVDDDCGWYEDGEVSVTVTLRGLPDDLINMRVL